MAEDAAAVWDILPAAVQTGRDRARDLAARISPAQQEQAAGQPGQLFKAVSRSMPHKILRSRAAIRPTPVYRRQNQRGAMVQRASSNMLVLLPL